MSERPASATPLRRPDQLGPGRLLLRTFHVWLRNAPAFTLVGVVIQLPIAALELHAGPLDESRLTPLLFVFLWFLSMIAGGALATGVLSSLQGKRAGAVAMLGAVSRHLWPLFAVAVVYALSFVIGFFLLVVPGVLAFLAGYLAIPAVMDHPEIGAPGALRLSWILTEGNRLALLAALAILFGIQLGGMLAAGALVDVVETGPQGKLAGVVISSLTEAVLNGLSGCCAAVAYVELQARKSLARTVARPAA